MVTGSVFCAFISLTYAKYYSTNLESPITASCSKNIQIPPYAIYYLNKPLCSFSIIYLPLVNVNKKDVKKLCKITIKEN